MKKYIKPQIQIKSLIQKEVVTAEDDNTVQISVPNTWWPSDK